MLHLEAQEEKGIGIIIFQSEQMPSSGCFWGYCSTSAKDHDVHQQLVTAICIRTEICLVLQNALELIIHCVFQLQNGNSSEELYIPGKFGAPITQFDKSGSTPWSKLMLNVTILILVSFIVPKYSLYRTKHTGKLCRKQKVLVTSWYIAKEKQQNNN